ncbi:ABC transporter permease [Caldisalinibacter kiritimatiensis]|uniref:ABC-type antimicrobial peptide transport system, permease component n=1 Tax=Caldisalinibacter kiritimatiensis TaxID=1304284 RepID=R1CLK5_9FIRM|nr:FtsX-like permease family protein [Caldisalinibacter kiritimatiensis]EOC99570.1 ABC-type antimicrobial peptide transport system, permease component [Caldisalinibacter kiritimatiensis]
MKKLDLRLLRSIKNSKGQFIAITVLVMVGLIVYTALSMAAVNLEDTINYYYDITNFSDIYVEVVKIQETALEKVKHINGVDIVEGRIVHDVPLKIEDGEEKANIRIISLPEDNDINIVYKIEGSDIENKSKDTLLLQQFANARDITIGGTIRPQIQGKVYNLNVKGIVASSEYIYLMENEQNLLPMPEKFGVAYVSEEFARQSFGYKDSYNEVLIKVKENWDVEKVKKEVEEELDKYGVKRIYTKDEQLSDRIISEEIDGVKKSSSSMPIIFLGVAAVIIAAMLSRMVRNDRTSIGVLKALGYSDKNIILHYTKYSLIIGFVGSLLGIIIGTILSGYIAELYTHFFNIPMLKFKFYYVYTITGIILTVIFCIAAGMWGARKIMKIHPAESMRPEPPKSGGRIFLDRLGILWKRLSFSWKMVLRNIFRNKKRFIFITLGIAMTYAITLLPVVTKDSFTEIFSSHYGGFQKMDYNINFDRPLNVRVVKDLKHIVEVEEIEPKIEYPFELVYGTKEKVVNIIGVPKDTEFYSFINLEGQPIRLPNEGIILSESIARYLGVNKGDKIKIESYIPNKDDMFIEVKDVIKQSLGLNGYMNISYMQNKLTDKEMATGVYLDSSDDVKNKLEDIKYISSVQSLEDMSKIFEQFLQLTIFSIGVMLIFSGVLGFVIVYNSTIMSISERRLEFSSLRVMGFSKTEIFNMITKENIVMTILGVVFGIPLGRYMLEALEEMFSTELYVLEMNASISTYIITMLVTTIFVLLAQFATYKKIDRLDFIEALKTRIS